MQPIALDKTKFACVRRQWDAQVCIVDRSIDLHFFPFSIECSVVNRNTLLLLLYRWIKIACLWHRSYGDTISVLEASVCKDTFGSVYTLLYAMSSISRRRIPRRTFIPQAPHFPFRFKYTSIAHNLLIRKLKL